MALAPRGVVLDSLSWDSQSSAAPQTQPGQVTLRLPPLDGAGWLALLAAPLSPQLDSRSVLRLPTQIALSTPRLLLGGQAWHQLSLALTRQGRRRICAPMAEKSAVPRVWAPGR